MNTNIICALLSNLEIKSMKFLIQQCHSAIIHLDLLKRNQSDKQSSLP